MSAIIFYVEEFMGELVVLERKKPTTNGTAVESVEIHSVMTGKSFYEIKLDNLYFKLEFYE